MHGALEREARLQPRKTEPLPSPPETAFAAPTPVFLASIRETDETYRGVVAVLNDKLRVVAGSCGLQWVIQKRKNPLAWSSFAFCATKEGLLLRLPKYGHGCDAESSARIQALPDYFRNGFGAPAQENLSWKNKMIILSYARKPAIFGKIQDAPWTLRGADDGNQATGKA